MKQILSVLAIAALFVACGPPPDSIYDDTDQSNSSCKDAPFNSGPGEQGDLCDNAKLDCNVTCCQCKFDDFNGGDNSFWASECYRGRCDQADACHDVCAARGEN